MVTFTDGIDNITGDTHLSASLPHLADEGLKQGTLQYRAQVSPGKKGKTNDERTLPEPTLPTIATNEPLGIFSSIPFSSNGFSFSFSVSLTSLLTPASTTFSVERAGDVPAGVLTAVGNKESLPFFPFFFPVLLPPFLSLPNLAGLRGCTRGYDDRGRLPE